MNIERTLEFLDQFEPLLPQPAALMASAGPPAPADDAPPAPSGSDKQEAGVVKSQLIAFTSGLDSQYKDAVKYSTQLAQMAADKKFDHIKQRMEWYDAYSESLKILGWVGSTIKLTEYKNSNLEITMEEVAIELLKLAAGPNAALIADLTSATINALKQDENVLSKLQMSSSSGSTGAFDILPALQHEDDVVLYTHAMVFEQHKSSGGFWFWSWKLSDMSLSHAANQWTLNYDFYKSVEPRAKKILGQSTDAFFDSLSF